MKNFNICTMMSDEIIMYAPENYKTTCRYLYVEEQYK